MSYSKTDKDETIIIGRVTSYNVNTFKGRVYVPEEKRPIPFTLADYARVSKNIDHITSSLTSSAQDIRNDERDLRCYVIKVRSRTGRLKHMIVTSVLSPK